MGAASVGDSEPAPLGLPLFQDDLNEMFPELEKNLPAHPVPGPHSPQIPSPPRDPAATCGRSVQPLRKADAVVAPVATPCRVGLKEPAPAQDQAWLRILFIKVEVMHNPIDFQIMVFENRIAFIYDIFYSLSCRIFGACQLSWISLQSPCKAVFDIISSDEEGPDTGCKLDGAKLSQEELIQIITGLLDTKAFLGRNRHRTINILYYTVFVWPLQPIIL